MTAFDRLTPVAAGMIAVPLLALSALGLWVIVQSHAPRAALGQPTLLLNEAAGVLLFVVLGAAAAERATGTERRTFRGRAALAVYWVVIALLLVDFAVRLAATR